MKIIIGVFDSGIGGLSVVKQIDLLVNVQVIYLGDIARIPYGTKSVKTIREFTKQLVVFLLNKKVSMVLIACNTISSVAHDVVKECAKEIPVLNIIHCCCNQIYMDYKKIAILGTKVTIESGEYQKRLCLNNKLTVITQACNLFVPIIEYGLYDTDILLVTMKYYLKQIDLSNLNALVLGCTHYSLIKDKFLQVIPKVIKIINPSDIMAQQVKNILGNNNLSNTNQKKEQHILYVTDYTPEIKTLIANFLPNTNYRVSIIDYRVIKSL